MFKVRSLAKRRDVKHRYFLAYKKEGSYHFLGACDDLEQAKQITKIGHYDCIIVDTSENDIAICC